MGNAILATGHKFLTADHLRRLESAGYEVERLEQPDGTDGQLIGALQGKRGYVCAGMERVSSAVISATDQLEVIAFPGSGFTEFIPGWQTATRRGIAVSAQIGVNSPSVAEFTMTVMMAMLRRLHPLLHDEDPGPWPARELSSLRLGVIGFGHSGQRIAALAQRLGMDVVIAARRPRNDIPAGMQQVSVEELLNTSDVVTVHVDRINGIHVLGKPDIKHMKAGALLVNVAFPEAIEWEAVRQSILEGNIRAAYDAPPDGKWDDLPNSRFLAMPRQAAFDTLDSNNRIGDRIVDALLALLSGEASPTVVNPDYLSYRQSPNR